MVQKTVKAQNFTYIVSLYKIDSKLSNPQNYPADFTLEDNILRYEGNSLTCKIKKGEAFVKNSRYVLNNNTEIKLDNEYTLFIIYKGCNGNSYNSSKSKSNYSSNHTNVKSEWFLRKGSKKKNKGFKN